MLVGIVCKNIKERSLVANMYINEGVSFYKEYEGFIKLKYVNNNIEYEVLLFITPLENKLYDMVLNASEVLYV